MKKYILGELLMTTYVCFCMAGLTAVVLLAGSHIWHTPMAWSTVSHASRVVAFCALYLCVAKAWSNRHRARSPQ